MRAHLHHISGIQTNKEVPPILAKVASSKTQAGGLARLDRFMGKGMDYWKIFYGGPAGIIHMSLTLYNNFETSDGGNENSLSSPTKEVKYHYHNEIMVITR